MLTILTPVDPVAGAAEIAKMFGVSRQRVQQMTRRADFPAPAATLTMGKVWWTEDVKNWAEQRGRNITDDSDD